ncbi:hypothetical protein R5R35_005198 [Gryllus longicercus]|uniref:Uncharacterized protein n=1 Tax=Gryllus longicercus TaxID=2509291 RepID=A0AAN9W1Q4_9ORTH
MCENTQHETTAVSFCIKQMKCIIDIGARLELQGSVQVHNSIYRIVLQWTIRELKSIAFLVINLDLPIILTLVLSKWFSMCIKFYLTTHSDSFQLSHMQISFAPGLACCLIYRDT